MYTKDDIAPGAARCSTAWACAEHVDKRADRLSGGQRQRVGIARALIQNPKLLLVDEPTSSLDPKISREVMSLIREIAREFHIPVLCNIHDVDLACDFCTSVIGLQDGLKKFEGRPAELDKRGAAGHLRDGGAVNAADALALRVDGIAAGAAARPARCASRLTYAVILIAVAWSIRGHRRPRHRLEPDPPELAARVGAGRFTELDTGVVPELWEPALETVVMATLATVARPGAVDPGGLAGRRQHHAVRQESRTRSAAS